MRAEYLTLLQKQAAVAEAPRPDDPARKASIEKAMRDDRAGYFRSGLSDELVGILQRVAVGRAGEA